MSIGIMMGAHTESKNKADRIRETWKTRHAGANGKESGVASGVYPVGGTIALRYRPLPMRALHQITRERRLVDYMSDGARRAIAD